MSQAREHAHSIVIEPSAGQVTVARDGVVLAQTRRAMELREGSLPVRYYIPREDVRMDLLTSTESASHCPFKGDAVYWSIDGVPDVAWSYERPIPSAEPIAGLIAFYNEKTNIEVEP
jgi:uncharacterized protein (DUF427 family)